ncbi:MerC domain-containing protein [Sulfidibacter corallicola]|uniref:MerC domain-containing protein n=1 Tax=Sulfidibacter corallicola TaxID=2818388 RepID=A0A8A4TXN4_SULCO|nr:MerC domain-containing protein [Sulfidibacter corallicola]QTD54243.1 MerC domain-containing protein [Sulfidibacter corallicola]
MIAISEHRLDQFGVVASTACALHCMILGLAPVALATSGLGALFGHEAEWAFSLSAGLLALLAAAFGFRAHGSVRVVAILLGGTTALIVSRFLEEWGVHGFGTVIGIFGGLGLVSGHFLNLKARRDCECCSTCLSPE